MLDPFCGTGRTIIAASELGAYSIGIDVNPLATLIVKAKKNFIRPENIQKFLQEIKDNEDGYLACNLYDLEYGRRVKWFPTKANLELQSIISC